MINKLISKTQVRLLEYDGNPSDDYNQGYIRAIQDVLDLDTVPTLGVDEIEKIRTEIDKAYDDLDGYDPHALGTFANLVSDILDKHIGK